jgi:predicted nucleotidyltransferase
VEQNLTNEIVALLLREDLHTRAIAERLDSNHATVIRKLRDLTEDNIVDFRAEGKNKVYFIKKTLEGRNAAIIAEMYKQSMAVSRYPVLRGIIRAVLEVPDIPLALLYGSYAKGLAKKDSDIDIFIEPLNTSLKKQLEQRNSSMSVQTRGLRIPGTCSSGRIIRVHIIIKGVEVYFDKTGFFEKTA